MKRTIIFDLDGTLVDIEPIFLQLYNTLADEFRLPLITAAEVLIAKDWSLKKFIIKRLGWRLFLFPRFYRRGKALYFDFLDRVTLFPGIAEACKTLHQRGFRLGILSSSEERTIQTIIDRYHLPIDFFAESSLFHKAHSLKNLLNQQKLTPEDIIYVGDELRDVEACKKAGVEVIAVTWGLNSKKALVATGVQTADTSEDLLQLLLQEKTRE